MSAIRGCLYRLVKQGKISQKAADDAAAIHEGLQGRLIGYMPPVSADAAAALEAAKIMAEAARREKLRVVKDAIAYGDAEQYVINHPTSRIAGVMGVLTRDIREGAGGAGRLNVESHSVAIEDWLLGKANAMLEQYRSKVGGLVRNFAGPRNMVRELLGKDTGDPGAKEAAAAWDAATNAGVDRAEKAGITYRSMTEKSQWRLPQFWEPSRVKSLGRDAFEKDVFAEWRQGGLDVMDKRTGEVAQELDVPRIVKEAAEHIAINEDPSARGSAFNDTMRTFRFKDPETWIRLQEKYGPGRGGVYGMLTSHLRGMSRELALTEVLGPSYHSNFNRLLDLAKLQETERSLPSRLNPIRFVESVTAARRTFQVLTGEVNSVQGEMMAGFFGALRNIASAAKLGSATVTAVPGDSVNAVLAAQHNGISGARVLARALEGMIKESPELRAEASRLNITAHAVIDSMASGARFASPEFSARFGQLAQFAIRASGLNFWTANLKRAFSMEFLSYLAENAGKGFAALDAPFQRFLDRYGFTAEDWDKIRDTAPFEHEGAKFFDIEGVADKGLRDRLASAVVDERQFAVVESTARTRQLTTAGLTRGTLMGEIARSAGMFKGYPLSVLLTHGMRSITAPRSLLGVGAALSLRMLLPMTLAGAASLQAKYLLAGKDLANMKDPMFWLNAFITGGGSGVYGDLLNSAVAPGSADTKLSALFGGPAVQAIDTGQHLTLDQIKSVLAGKKQHFGAVLAQTVRQWTPGSTLWYARLGLDRLVFDEIQQAIDPNYLEAFHRQEKRVRDQTGQRYWWRPGHTEPSRAPGLTPVQ